MRKISTLLFIVAFLMLPNLIVLGQFSLVFADNDNLASNPTLLWNYITSNGVWSSPTVDNGVLYVGCEDIVYTGVPYGQGLQYFYAGNLYAINAASGAKIWNYSIPVGGSSPAVADGIVYVGSFDGNVYAFNATNGVKLWNYPTGDVVSSSPAVADGLVYIGLSDGNLCALNSTAGDEVWKFQSSGGVGSPVVKNGVVFVISNAFIPVYAYAGDIYALNASSGKMLWDFSTNNSVTFPTIFGKTLYAGVGSNVSALNSIDGSQLWSKNISKQVSLSPPVLRPTAVLGNALFVGSSDGSVYALNSDDGEKIWNQSLGNLSGTSPYAVNDVTCPAAANGVIYIGSYDGNLYSLNATNGAIMWNYTISDRDHAVQSSPIVVNGVVYIGSGDHHVYALTISQTPKNQISTLTILAAVIATIIAIVILTLFLLFRNRKTRDKTE